MDIEKHGSLRTKEATLKYYDEYVGIVSTAPKEELFLRIACIQVLTRRVVDNGDTVHYAQSRRSW